MSRISSLQTLLSLTARTGDGSSGESSVFKVESAESIRIFANVTVNAGSDDLDLVVLGSPDNSVWWVLSTFTTFSSVKSDANSSTLTTSISHPPKYIKIKYTVENLKTITFGVYLDKKAGI